MTANYKRLVYINIIIILLLVQEPDHCCPIRLSQSATLPHGVSRFIHHKNTQEGLVAHVIRTIFAFNTLFTVCESMLRNEFFASIMKGSLFFIITIIRQIQIKNNNVTERNLKKHALPNYRPSL